MPDKGTTKPFSTLLTAVRSFLSSPAILQRINSTGPSSHIFQISLQLLNPSDSLYRRITISSRIRMCILGMCSCCPLSDRYQIPTSVRRGGAAQWHPRTPSTSLLNLGRGVPFNRPAASLRARKDQQAAEAQPLGLHTESRSNNQSSTPRATSFPHTPFFSFLFSHPYY